MSDGQKALTAGGARKEHALPDEITSIDVYFTVDETRFHSMVFNGIAPLEIGPTSRTDQRLVQRG